MSRHLLRTAILALLPLAACSRPGSGAGPAPAPDPFAAARERMVREQIEARGIRDPLTLAALRKVPRHLFVPAAVVDQAYGDFPLEIGEGQTISQPYIVGFMTQALQLERGDTVLEVGTGSGYQAAVLAEIASRVYSVEILEPLAEQARARLTRLGYSAIEVRAGDGYQGWRSAAPFDAIVVTAAAPWVPEPLLAQLADGGRLVIPVGDSLPQELVVVTRRGSAFEQQRVASVQFVPMTGEVRKEKGQERR